MSTDILCVHGKARKGEQVSSDTKRFTMRCPAWCGTTKDDADYCGDEIQVAATERPDGLYRITEVTPCRYHAPSDRWDAAYTLSDLQQHLNEGNPRFMVEVAA